MQLDPEVVAALETLDPDVADERRALESLTMQLIAGREDPGAALTQYLTTSARRVNPPPASRPAGVTVVTGGTGTIGRTLLRRLEATGATRLISIARRSPETEQRIPGVEYRQLDVRDFDELLRTFREIQPELVFHLAAQRDPGQAERDVIGTLTTNVLGTDGLLMAAGMAGIERVVVASTGKAFRL